MFVYGDQELRDRSGFVLFFGCDECGTIFDFVVQMFNTATKNTPSAGPTDKEIGARHSDAGNRTDK